jgi:transmembrane sensor
MDRIEHLFNKYKNNKCTPEEFEELLSHYKAADQEDVLKNNIETALYEQAEEDADLQEDVDEIYSQLQAHILNEQSRSKKPLYFKLSIAASVILCLSFGAYFIVHNKQAPAQIAQTTKHDLLPGTDRAILTVSNGKKIDISGAGEGRIVVQGDIAVNKTTNGSIVYQHADQANESNKPVYNTMTTPRGGQYPLTLSDGTKVWLDAASSITFPVVFIGNERTVEITGQAYFEVAHNAAKPFKVTANGQMVEVLGTHFNINAYTDEPDMKTTLLEGSVKITKNGQSAMLTPGQQAIVPFKAGSIETKTADVNEAIAWHMGLFKFNNANIQTVMRQLARWYDVDISYEGDIPDRRFSGEIYRNVNASKIADILSYKQIHFRIDGKKITVLP